MNVAKLALALLLSCLPGVAFAQPVPPDVGAVGGAVELPEFNLSAEPSALQTQLSAHRERLASAQEQLRRDPGNTTVSVLADQLAFRISLLEILLEPLPSPAPSTDARRVQLEALRGDREELAALAERGKSQGIGASNQSVLEARLAEIDALIAQLDGAGVPATAPPNPAPAAPNAPPSPGGSAAPAVPTPPPNGGGTPPTAPPDPVTPAPDAVPEAAPPLPAEGRTPPHLTLGDLISTLGNLQARMDEVVRLPEPLDASRVFVVPANALFPGNGNGPTRRAINRGYFTDLRAFIADNPVLMGALSSSGYTADQAIGLLTDREGNIVIFVDR